MSEMKQLSDEFQLPSITIKKSQIGELWSKGLVSYEQLLLLSRGSHAIATMPRNVAEHYGLKI